MLVLVCPVEAVLIEHNRFLSETPELIIDDLIIGTQGVPIFMVYGALRYAYYSHLPSSSQKLRKMGHSTPILRS